LGGSRSSLDLRGGSGAGLATLCGLLALASPAGAEEGELIYKRGQFYEDGRTISVSLGFREMLDAGSRARLKNGFATTVVMRAYLYEKSGEAPIAFSARTLRAVYDLWDEQFILRVEEPGRTRHLRFRNQSDVVDRLTSVYRLPLARVELCRPGVQYFVAVIAEVNPMSEALLAEVRKWLRNPSGDRRGAGSESFFGSFVSIFVNNKIRSAEKTFRVRSQPFYRRP
jgi:hypothetical protein